MPPAETGTATEKHNTITLILHQVLFRVAWIFKTESVVMPAFLDSITSAGWVSGLLPPINRLGQSVMPLLLSGHLRDTPLKSRWLPRTTLLMGLPFIALSGMLFWSPAASEQWMPMVFLCLYAVFFATTGTNLFVHRMRVCYGQLLCSVSHRRTGFPPFHQTTQTTVQPSTALSS